MCLEMDVFALILLLAGFWVLLKHAFLMLAIIDLISSPTYITAQKIQLKM